MKEKYILELIKAAREYKLHKVIPLMLIAMSILPMGGDELDDPSTF